MLTHGCGKRLADRETGDWKELGSYASQRALDVDGRRTATQLCTQSIMNDLEAMADGFQKPISRALDDTRNGGINTFKRSPANLLVVLRCLERLEKRNPLVVALWRRGQAHSTRRLRRLSSVVFGSKSQTGKTVARR